MESECYNTIDIVLKMTAIEIKEKGFAYFNILMTIL